MDVSEARRLKALEEENTKLKRLYGEAMLDNAGLKELLAKKWCRPPPGGRRSRISRRASRLSERRACSIIAADRSVVRYLSRRPDDTALRARLRELAD